MFSVATEIQEVLIKQILFQLQMYLFCLLCVNAWVKFQQNLKTTYLRSGERDYSFLLDFCFLSNIYRGFSALKTKELQIPV